MLKGETFWVTKTQAFAEDEFNIAVSDRTEQSHDMWRGWGFHSRKSQTKKRALGEHCSGVVKHLCTRNDKVATAIERGEKIVEVHVDESRVHNTRASGSSWVKGERCVNRGSSKG